MKKYLKLWVCLFLIFIVIMSFSFICLGAKLTDQPSASGVSDADILHKVRDVSTTPVSESVTFTQIKAFLKTYFDGIYATLGANSDITSLSGITTPLTITQGGIGAATLTEGGVLLGSGTDAITAMDVLADGEIIVGDGTTDPVAESGATARTSLGAAASGVNADITSMTGLDDDGIPGTKVANALLTSLAVADLGDAATPSVLTTAETTNKLISNYKASGADHVFTMPAAHINGNVIFMIGDEFQVDIEPDSGANFFLNGTAMAADEHIQNTADTLGDELIGYCANINGTLTWMFHSTSANFVEETP